MKLSVIIVTWNSAADIEACIDSINFGSEFEVIVVDNASSDATRDKLSTFHHLKLVANGANYGYAHANNQGIRLATGEYVLLLNPDTRIELGALDTLARYLDTHPVAGAVAPRLTSPDGTTQFSVRSLPTAGSILLELTGLARLFPQSRVFGRWKMKYFDYNRPAEVEQPMASCLMLRRTALASLAPNSSLLTTNFPMDEQFPIFYNDVDFSKRMADAGWKTAYLPDARVVHRHGASTKQVRAKMIRESHRSAFRYLRKHDRSGLFWLKAVVLLPLLELSGLVRVIAYRLRRNRKD
ncbi:MAG: glycosyltransferase family 2 protein [candidate division WOR-3 bacterium]|nr:glycosyltransferase family 2 protein [candidate division WOR-3 bacterium]